MKYVFRRRREIEKYGAGQVDTCFIMNFLGIHNRMYDSFVYLLYVYHIRLTQSIHLALPDFPNV